MKKVFSAVAVIGIIGMSSVVAMAGPIFIGVDAAPNVYGSPDYASWQADAFASVANGTFVNMENGINSANVGTTNFEIQDEVVYSFGDLGKRLTWTYYLEGESVAALEGTNRFQVSLTNLWNGIETVFYDNAEPTKWIDYDSDGDGATDSVVGMGGMAWWGAYGHKEDTSVARAALDADILSWGAVAESYTFSARLYRADGSGSFDQTTIVSNRDAVPAPVPEPATMLLFGTGLVGLAAVRRGKKA